MAKLNTNNNGYIIAYATILVVIVAFLLAFISSALKPTQDKNVQNDVKSQILKAVLVDTPDVEATFDKTVKDNLWDGSQLVPYTGEFITNYNPEIKAGHFHVFVVDVNGQTKYVLPVYGMGLWGPIWGYIALNQDKQTVYGAYFNHESETAGLGAEIKDSKAWQAKFKGKEVAEGDKIVLGVKKASDKPDPKCEVDAVTGATLTSNGVNQMLKTSLANYLTFINAK